MQLIVWDILGKRVIVNTEGRRAMDGRTHQFRRDRIDPEPIATGFLQRSESYRAACFPLPILETRHSFIRSLFGAESSRRKKKEARRVPDWRASRNVARQREPNFRKSPIALTMGAPSVG